MLVIFSAAIELPEDIPDVDIEKWLKFYLGEVCELSGDNALSKTDMQSIGCKNVNISRITY